MEINESSAWTKMRILILFLLLFVTTHVYGNQKEETVRILKLFPYLVQPPLVNPALPTGFVLGEKEDDPYFSSGYFWGEKGSLRDYFESPTALKGCLIRSQVATTVKQIGFDRFSNDGQVYDLTAAGFTEIKVSRGKWGIFPYRDLVAKGPRGRKYYQLWVGLNTDEGTTLCFQFLYPEYLNEPTQHQKLIWDNFVHKTDLLGMDDLLVARKAQHDRQSLEHTLFCESLVLSAEKRRFDQKLLIHLDLLQTNVEVVGVKELSLFNKYTPGKPCLEIALMLKGKNSTYETVRTSYDVVDHFSFKSPMLSLQRFIENDHFLLFQ